MAVAEAVPFAGWVLGRWVVRPLGRWGAQKGWWNPVRWVGVLVGGGGRVVLEETGKVMDAAKVAGTLPKPGLASLLRPGRFFETFQELEPVWCVLNFHYFTSFAPYLPFIPSVRLPCSFPTPYAQFKQVANGPRHVPLRTPHRPRRARTHAPHTAGSRPADHRELEPHHALRRGIRESTVVCYEGPAASVTFSLIWNLMLVLFPLDCFAADRLLP